MDNFTILLKSHYDLKVNLEFDPYKEWSTDNNKEKILPKIMHSHFEIDNAFFATIEIDSKFKLLKYFNTKIREVKDGNDKEKSDLNKTKEKIKKLEISPSMNLTYRFKETCDFKHFFETKTQLISQLDKLFKLLNESSQDEMIVEIKGHFLFPSAKYRFIGLSFPQKISLQGSIVEQLGDVGVYGFSLKFEKSPLGLKKIEIEQNDESIDLFVKYEFKIPNLNSFLDSDAYLPKIISLFIEEKSSV